MDEQWDVDFANLLAELSAAQSELLSVLETKRTRLGTRDLAQIEELQPRETELIKRLQACQQRRQVLLEQATEAGSHAKTLRGVARTLPRERRLPLEPALKTAHSQARLLQHHAIANWVIAQKTLIHLSQLLEIIATGGQLQPTYDQRGDGPSPGGVLLNEVG